MTDPRVEAARKAAAQLQQKYGPKAGVIGTEMPEVSVISTGVLALDYALGTGGWPRGEMVEIYGKPDIGKTSVLGYAALASAQKQGLLVGLINLEPRFQPEWAYKNGVDPEMCVIALPRTGEQAFEILYDWVNSTNTPDCILFDSIGQVQRASELEDKGKVNQGGASALISWGIRRCLGSAFHEDKVVIFLNHVRDDMNASIKGYVTSPGGWVPKHSCSIRVELKRGQDRLTVRNNLGGVSEDEEVGYSIVAQIRRNKMAEVGAHRKAIFLYRSKSTEEYGPVGIDKTYDVVATGIRTGVIKKSGGWLSHPSFPGEKHHLNGNVAVGKFLEENPDVYDIIRDDILGVMKKAST